MFEQHMQHATVHHQHLRAGTMLLENPRGGFTSVMSPGGDAVLSATLTVVTVAAATVAAAAVTDGMLLMLAVFLPCLILRLAAAGLLLLPALLLLHTIGVVMHLLLEDRQPAVARVCCVPLPEQNLLFKLPSIFQLCSVVLSCGEPAAAAVVSKTYSLEIDRTSSAPGATHPTC